MKYLRVLAIPLFMFISAINVQSELTEAIQKPKKITFEFSSGLMTTDFSSLASARDDAISDASFPLKVTRDYPTNPFFKGALLLTLGKSKFGLTFQHFSTSTIVQNVDTQTDYHFEQTVKVQEIGLTMRIPIEIDGENWKCNIVGGFGVANFDYLSVEKMKIGDEHSQVKDDYFNSTQYLELGGQFIYDLGSFGIGIGASLMLLPDNDSPLGLDGGRASLLVSFSPF